MKARGLLLFLLLELLSELFPRGKSKKILETSNFLKFEFNRWFFFFLHLRCLADKVGRKYLQMGLSLPFIVSWMIITFVKKILALYIARFLAGVATGGICVAAPLYIGEIAENSIRGRLGSYFQVILIFAFI